MKIKGKIIGALLGLMFFGPIGMALGFITGHLYDLGYFQAFLDVTQGPVHTEAQQIFFNNTFKVMGYVAKSDGRVSENEIRAAQSIMSELGLSGTFKQQAIQLFSLGKESDFNVNQSLFELRQVCRMQPALLQLFLDIQLKMATADGDLSSAKKATLQHICTQLGVSHFQFHQYENPYQRQQYYHQRQSRTENTVTLQEAYQILNISHSATHEEIKKAYRRLMSQNHPDKLMAKGLPPEMIKVATQKTQRIKQAYEQIKQAKGI